MSFIRPEAQENLWRMREIIVGVGFVLLGLWMATGGRGILTILGALVMIGGIALAIAGWQRTRFRRVGKGPGVVNVTEGQITYFGPITGGTLAAASISELVLNPIPDAEPVWEIRSPGRTAIHIPTNAEGADALFDVFGGLHGLQMEELLDILADPGPVPRIVWTQRLLH